MKHLIATLVVTLLGIALVKCADKRVRFDNYHVYQLQPKTRQQLEVLKKLESSPLSYIFLDGVHYLDSKIHVMVDPESVPKFVKSLAKTSVPFKLVDRNAQASLGHDEIADSNTRTGDYTWEKYHTLNNTYNWLYSLQEKYPHVKVEEAGESYEGRKILCLKISYGPDRKTVFLEGGIHAREWISPATTTYIANQVLTSQDKEVRSIVESVDWVICPHTNPDGYVYTHTTNRAWRKTRTPYGGKCYGADPNRNWGNHWNEVGSSNEPCSDTYAGPGPFSEKETQSLAAYIRTNFQDKILLYVSYHSYSQLLLFPYGYTEKLPRNYAYLKRVFEVAIDSISKRYGTKYTGGNIYNAIYPASGSSVDYSYDVLNAKFSYCYELRPSKNAFWTGFKLPADQIIPTGEESFDSLMAMIKEICNLNLF